MKYLKYFGFMLSIFLFVSCSSTTEPSAEDELVSILEQSKKSLDSAVTIIFDDASKAGTKILAGNYDESLIRSELKAILAKHSTVLEVVFVNDKSVMTYVEPSTYKSSEGVDISTQEHQIEMTTKNKNAMSGIFKLVENFYGVVIASPIINNGKYAGSVNVVIRPDYFISFYTDKYVKDKFDDSWVMETNGNILHDTDPTQTGRNLFTDSLYLPYPTLITAGNTIVNGDSGKTNYSFLDKSKNKNVTKDVWWRTSTFFNKVWKLSIVKERI